ncbi:MAG: hypothetical protein J6X52_03790, partial [Clostridia bacterium]|nr:hypothetical protein [Clostridia bacterium]
MKLVRSFIPFILIACLLLTISACSGGEGNQSSPVSESGDPADNSADGSAAVSDEPVSEAPYAPAA